MLLVVPTQIGFEKERLPWLTFIIAILCICVFFTFQFSESNKTDNIVEYYEHSDLFSIEIEGFNRYLQTPSALKHYRKVSNIYTEGPDRVFFMIFDEDFRRFIEIDLKRNQSPDYQIWKALANELKYKKKEIISFSYGVKSSDSSLFPLLSHQFLHGGIDHLIGNMIFLIIFGLGVETLFGRLRWLLIYVGSGVVGAFVFTMLDGKPFMPLIGASGAISGLMGAYVAYFGLQKIRFFAWFGFYFNQYLWPAVGVLIFWLFKEGVNYLTETESNVAFMAHFGGLCFGALMGFILKPSQTKSTQENRNSENIEEVYSKALAAIRKLDIEQARLYLNKVLEINPNHIDALKNLYHIEKTSHKSIAFESAVNKVFSLDLSFETADHFILSVAQETLPDKITLRQIKIEAFFNLLHRQLRNDQVQTSEPLIKVAKRSYASNSNLPQLLLAWSQALLQRGKVRSASLELNYLSNYYGETAQGAHAKQLLSKLRQ